MDALEAIRTRRSVRAYTGEPVGREVIEAIVDCGRLAATANNLQPWEFVVITDRERLRSIAAKTDYGRFIAECSACIVILCRDTKYYLEDGSAATQNILVAARALGLGSCWVAGDKKGYAEEVRKDIGAPEGYRVVSLVSIGPAADERHARKRRLEDVIHWERY